MKTLPSVVVLPFLLLSWWLLSSDSFPQEPLYPRHRLQHQQHQTLNGFGGGASSRKSSLLVLHNHLPRPFSLLFSLLAPPAGKTSRHAQQKKPRQPSAANKNNNQNGRRGSVHCDYSNTVQDQDLQHGMTEICQMIDKLEREMDKKRTLTMETAAATPLMAKTPLPTTAKADHGQVVAREEESLQSYYQQARSTIPRLNKLRHELVELEKALEMMEQRAIGFNLNAKVGIQNKKTTTKTTTRRDIRRFKNDRPAGAMASTASNRGPEEAATSPAAFNQTLLKQTLTKIRAKTQHDQQEGAEIPQVRHCTVAPTAPRSSHFYSTASSHPSTSSSSFGQTLAWLQKVSLDHPEKEPDEPQQTPQNTSTFPVDEQHDLRNNGVQQVPDKNNGGTTEQGSTSADLYASIDELTKQWAMTNTEKVVPHGTAAMLDYLEQRQHQAQQPSATTTTTSCGTMSSFSAPTMSVDNMARDWTLMNQDESITNQHGQRVSSTSSLPDRYELVTRWAESKQVPPTANHVRNYKVASMAVDGGKSRWGELETKRAQSLSCAMCAQVNMDHVPLKSFSVDPLTSSETLGGHSTMPTQSRTSPPPSTLASASRPPPVLYTIDQLAKEWAAMNKEKDDSAAQPNAALGENSVSALNKGQNQTKTLSPTSAAARQSQSGGPHVSSNSRFRQAWIVGNRRQEKSDIETNQVMTPQSNDQHIPASTTATSNRLQQEWAARNKETDSETRQSASVPLFVTQQPPKEARPAPIGNVASSSSSSVETTMNRLACEWAVMNKDSDDSPQRFDMFFNSMQSTHTASATSPESSQSKKVSSMLELALEWATLNKLEE